MSLKQWSFNDNSTCSSKDRDSPTIFWRWIKGRKGLVFVCFYCYDVIPWPKELVEERVCLACPSWLQSWREVRTELKAETEQKQRPWGILLTDLLLLTCSVCSPLSHRNTCPGIVLPTTVVCTLTYQSLIKKMPQQVCQYDRSIIFFKVNSNLCQVDQNPTRIRICFRYLSTDCIPPQSQWFLMLYGMHNYIKQA